MPDKTLKVVTYAAGASLAAITLIYVFGPTYLLDNDASRSASGAFSNRRKGGGVGLSNPANDCFINSVLQALAGLGDLRLYLIRELHRRNLDGESVYAQPVPPGALAESDDETAQPRFGKDTPDWKLEGLQRGSVTKSLKDILDALNERPLYKKTISAAPFVRALEEAFRQRISRQQQDAQEFLQVVAERLCDEYHAGRRARWYASRTVAPNGGFAAAQPATEEGLGAEIRLLPDPTSNGRLSSARLPAGTASGAAEDGSRMEGEHNVDDQERFPLEGRFESQIECLTCGFKPRPTTSAFCTLTLHVPRASSTTLGACFDGMFKTEYIDDFKCEKCRLVHALALLESDTQRLASGAAKAKAQAALERLRLAVDNDPENPPEDVALPDMRHAPKRKIARHIRLTEFPSILAIHLSRSIFDASRLSQKNSAKVAFPEELPLGSLLQQRKYKLLGVVTHKGSHHSGHYESFRRQNIYPPFSNPSTFQASDAYSRRTSPASTPRIQADGQLPEKAATPAQTQDSLDRGSGANLALPAPYPAATPAGSSCSSLLDGEPGGGSTVDSQCATLAHTARLEDSDTVSEKPDKASRPSSTPRVIPSPSHTAVPGTVKSERLASTRPPPAVKSKQRKQQARWWRISDDKVKEASTRDVLGMQREVYLLFYELERSHTPQ
jgi:ubiquitin carboxyl-terminal hydrolase 16